MKIQATDIFVFQFYKQNSRKKINECVLARFSNISLNPKKIDARSTVLFFTR